MQNRPIMFDNLLYKATFMKNSIWRSCWKIFWSVFKIHCARSLVYIGCYLLSMYFYVFTKQNNTVYSSVYNYINLHSYAVIWHFAPLYCLKNHIYDLNCSKNCYILKPYKVLPRGCLGSNPTWNQKNFKRFFVSFLLCSIFYLCSLYDIKSQK